MDDQPNTQSSENITPNGLPKPLIVALAGIGLAFLIVVALVLISVKNSGKKSSNITKQTITTNPTHNSNFQAQREQYMKALAANKNDTQALLGMVQSYSTEGNETGSETEQLKASQQYIDKLLKVDPYGRDTQLAVGYAYETAGDYQKALGYYKGATEVDSTSAMAWFRLGHDLEFLGQRQQAYQYYDKAYSIDPNNPLVLMARGNQLMSGGNPQGSYESFLKASEQPDIDNTLKADALTGAASARAVQDNYQYISDTLKLSKEAVDADPSFSPALATYGYTLYLTTPTNGDKSQAFDYLRKAIEANPRISKNYLTLSKFYRVKSDYPNAINYNKQAIDKADDDNTLLSVEARTLNKGMYEYELARTYYMANQYNLVIPTLKIAIQLNPDVMQTLKEDFTNNGQFTDFAVKPEFISLMAK